MTEEGDRWFLLKQDRKREFQAIKRRAQKRAWHAAQKAKRRPRSYTYKFNNQTTITEWELDELGNMSRKVIGE